MANMFNEDGTYNKTEWKAGDKITAVKLNKIELSLEAINNNDIDRHVEADSRLDILEERMANIPDNEQIDALEDMVKDNKDAADLAAYSINRKIESLKSVNADSRLDSLEGVNADTRLDALERVNANSRLDALEEVRDIAGFVIEDIDGAISYQSGSRISLKPGIVIDIPNATISNLDNIEFEGNRSTIDLTNEVRAFLKFSNIDNLIIRDLIITGLNTSRHASCYGLILENVTNFSIENVVVNGGNAAGIFITACHNGIINDCRVLNTLADGIHVTNKSSDITILNNYIYNTGDDGIAVVSYNKDEDVCRDIKIYSNSVYNSKSRGISNIGGENIIIESNIINNTSSSGIIVAIDNHYGTFEPKNTIVESNIISDAGYNNNPKGNLFGIELTGCDVVKIRNNTVRNSKTRGIVATSSATNISIINNTFVGGVLNQVDDQDGLLFIGNTIENFEQHGLYVNGAKNSIVSNNIFRNNATDGGNIYHNLRFGACNNINATNNLCVDDRTEVLTKRSCEITYSDNINIKGLISIGSYLGIASSTNTIVDNIVRNISPGNSDIFYAAGTFWINNSNGSIYVYDGTSWIRIGMI